MLKLQSEAQKHAKSLGHRPTNFVYAVNPPKCRVCGLRMSWNPEFTKISGEMLEKECSAS